jgi:hypothetical protein
MVCYGTIHHGGIKIKIPYIRISFYAYEKIENPKTCDRHPARTRSIRKYLSPIRKLISSS